MCHWCSQWERRTCANIKQSESVMLDYPSKNIFFFCSSCVVYLPNALSLFTNQYQPDEKFEIRLQSVEDKLSEKINNIEIKLQDYHKTVLGAYDSSEESPHNQRLSRSPISEDSIADITSSLTSEQKEKEKRQFNLILRNLKESDATDSTTRKQEDIKSCCSLFSYLDVSASVKMLFALETGIPDHVVY